MKLYLIRHGESQANLDYDLLKTVRDQDVELSNKGYYDAVEAGIRLKSILKDKVTSDETLYLVSTWTRARQTWTIVNGVLGGEQYAMETEMVIEHYMNLVNHPANWEIFKAYEATDWNVKQFLNVRYEGGESIRDVQQRAQDLLDTLKRDASNKKTAVVVCHGQFIKQVMCLVQGLDPDTVVHPKNGEIVELDI